MRRYHIPPISSVWLQLMRAFSAASPAPSARVTGYIRNGKNILRTSTSTVHYKRTTLRSAQLEKIKICNSFTNAFSGTGFFSKTFPAYGAKGTGHNRATSALMNQAIVNNSGVLHLSYPNVLISKGLLPKAEDAAAILLANDDITI